MIFQYSANQLKGNIVNWTNAKWEITNMNVEPLYPERMCKANSMGPVLIPEMLSAKGLKHLCNQVNGKVFLVKDDETRQISTMKRLGLLLLKSATPKCDGNSNLSISHLL